MHPEREEDQDFLRHAVVHGSGDREQDRVLRASGRHLGARRAPLHNPERLFPVQRRDGQRALQQDHEGRLQAAERGV